MGHVLRKRSDTQKRGWRMGKKQTKSIAITKSEEEKSQVKSPRDQTSQDENVDRTRILKHH